MSVNGMTVPSWYDGICPFCGGEFLTGEYIVYVDDEMWVHEDCTYSSTNDWESNA